MRLLIVGCEYAGKATLARAISHRLLAVTAAPSARSAADHSGADGAGRAGPRPIQWHNHFVVPRLDGHLIVHAAGDRTVIGKEAADLNTAEDEAQIIALRPSVLEQLQRHNIWRHLHPDLFRDDDTFFINHYYADAVYAPLYYGYGQPGTFSNRSARARAWDTELLERAPGHRARADTRHRGGDQRAAAAGCAGKGDHPGSGHPAHTGPLRPRVRAITDPTQVHP